MSETYFEGDDGIAKAMLVTLARLIDQRNRLANDLLKAHQTIAELEAERE